MLFCLKKMQLIHFLFVIYLAIWKEISIYTQQICIKVIKSNSKDICGVTEDFCFK